MAIPEAFKELYTVQVGCDFPRVPSEAYRIECQWMISESGMIWWVPMLVCSICEYLRYLVDRASIGLPDRIGQH